MHILAHRGLWENAAEQNTPEAFARAFDAGFGIETDVRDCRGRFVISHNPPRGIEPDFEDCLALLRGRPLPLAINIKADGLAEELRRVCLQHHVADWFVFDMSVPDMRRQLAAGNPVYARMSEVEQIPPWPDEASGIWLDGFAALWYDAAVLSALLKRFRVCVVSQELHGRDPAAQWAMLHPLAACERLSLCTDKPEAARVYFQRNAS